ncbi:grasp-with-spasm system SPASM domain peptide maturase [Chryseobacterium chendengshani]|uniref:grasp-with-spasm system SPASM domain peptide maturase n=1 Tax=Chryseobacterium sp. LJ668 TaxID=2864040 RepID=UPI001C689D25|nr:grasp-with-spasm system SPASM domain peptide maturase [Chryseobacterium sp. LJ668]MBW8522233.1 grasp-with-spasm system SPASM domain peptide maturase [Chryseobacterium sp. LJ668]QYK17876.1 grasp-with-spasm system SPASM domain peptide maturase [Chryseobacterium sp. LJ668]
MKKYIYLFSSCVPVKGASQSLICDLQRKDFEFIPNSLFDILTDLNNGRELNTIRSKYKDKDDIETFDSYIEFLLEKEFIFIDNSLLIDRFPKINFDFKIPAVISNSILDIPAEYNLNNIKNTVKQLDQLGCESIEIRFLGDFYQSYTDILRLFETSGIRSIKIMLNYFDFSDDFFLMIEEKYSRIREVYIYNSPDEMLEIETRMMLIYFLQDTTFSIKSCGFISDFYFSVNIKTFSESSKYNSCLHKKISIDSEGNIKNCPSMPQSFGNIKDTTLEEALNHEDFKKYWNLTKDKIEVCKDCEFRYICTDCRAYTERTHEDKEGLDTSKPLKCGYNPYTGDWEEWSTNPLKEKAIKYYGMQDLVKKN